MCCERVCVMCVCICVIDADKSRPNESTIWKSLFKNYTVFYPTWFYLFYNFGFNKPVMFLFCFAWDLFKTDLGFNLELEIFYLFVIRVVVFIVYELVIIFFKVFNDKIFVIVFFDHSIGDNLYLIFFQNFLKPSKLCWFSSFF